MKLHSIKQQFHPNPLMNFLASMGSIMVLIWVGHLQRRRGLWFEKYCWQTFLLWGNLWKSRQGWSFPFPGELSCEKRWGGGGWGGAPASLDAGKIRPGSADKFIYIQPRDCFKNVIDLPQQSDSVNTINYLFSRLFKDASTSELPFWPSMNAMQKNFGKIC